MCKGLSETEASASHAVFVGRGGPQSHRGPGKGGGCLPGSKFDPDVTVLPGSSLLRIGLWRFEPQVWFEADEKKVRS